MAVRETRSGAGMTLGETAFTIVGVMPPGLDYPSGVEVWRTVRSVPAGGVFGDAAHYEIDLIARLRPGVTIDQAASELATIAERLESNAPPDHPRGLVPVVRSFEDVIVGDVRPAMLALFGAVALVLLIAAANVANLLLLRGEVRSRELAVRAALGCRPRQDPEPAVRREPDAGNGRGCGSVRRLVVEPRGAPDSDSCRAAEGRRDPH